MGKMMTEEVNSKKQLLLSSVLFTVLFYLFANGQRFFSMSYSGDALLMIYQNDSAWQIALGRFMQPFLIMFRGGIVSPVLICTLSLCWLCLAVYFLVDYLELKKYWIVLLASSVLACNVTIVVANSAFLPYADFYSLALLCAVLGVWLIKKEKCWFTVIGTLFLSASMGIYQSYICVAIALIMMELIFKLLQKPDVKAMAKSVARYCGALIASAVVYFLVWKIFQKVFGIWTANTYNGLADMGDFSQNSVWTVIAKTYENVFLYFANPTTFITMPFQGMSLSIVWEYLLRFCNLMVVILLLSGLIFVNISYKTNWWQRLVQAVILLLFPMGVNFVCVISKGMEHTLMVYAFGLVYVLGMKVMDALMGKRAESAAWKKSFLPGLIMLVALLLVSWSNVVYSNQVYLKKDLQEKATHSMMTRIVYEIESVEGYEAGVTPVAFLGSFEASDYVPNPEPFRDLMPYGMGKSMITYTGTEYAYLTYMLNTNMNLTRVSNEAPEIQAMPVYPTKGSIAMIDGVVVVKISQ